jgi:molybdopterin-guanine dinucleotide biosynthesis protein A
MEEIDAVVLAAGRLSRSDASAAGHEVKALVRIGAVTPLDAILGALRNASRIRRIIVVGPTELRSQIQNYDRWVPEGVSAQENALAGLRTVTSQFALICSSDLPFVEAQHLDDFLLRVPSDAAFAYPIFERQEFLAVFPQGRARFAQVEARHWTGGSVCLVEVRFALANERLIRQAFAARKSPLAMASMLGAGVVFRHLTNSLRLDHILDRLERLTGAKAVAVRGAHPALAMDCDSLADIEYSRNRASVRDARASR